MPPCTKTAAPTTRPATRSAVVKANATVGCKCMGLAADKNPPKRARQLSQCFTGRGNNKDDEHKDDENEQGEEDNDKGDKGNDKGEEGADSMESGEGKESRQGEEDEDGQEHDDEARSKDPAPSITVTNDNEASNEDTAPSDNNASNEDTPSGVTGTDDDDDNEGSAPALHRGAATCSPTLATDGIMSGHAGITMRSCAACRSTADDDRAASAPPRYFFSLNFST